MSRQKNPFWREKKRFRNFRRVGQSAHSTALFINEPTPKAMVAVAKHKGKKQFWVSRVLFGRPLKKIGGGLSTAVKPLFFDYLEGNKNKDFSS